jgi:hypothetical protein
MQWIILVLRIRDVLALDIAGFLQALASRFIGSLSPERATSGVAARLIIEPRGRLLRCMSP